MATHARGILNGGVETRWGLGLPTLLTEGQENVPHRQLRANGDSKREGRRKVWDHPNTNPISRIEKIGTIYITSI